MRFLKRRRRRRNYNVPGDAHSLTFSCYRRYPFLSSERICLWLADAIEKARRELAFALWAYVLMPEHVHLLIWPRQREYDISAIRHSIKEPVGRKAIEFLVETNSDWLERVTRRRGNRVERLMWQSGGGFDRNIDKPTTLWQEIDYIHLNPERRKLVAKASDWKWSSAGWFEGCPKNELKPDPIPLDWYP